MKASRGARSEGKKGSGQQGGSVVQVRTGDVQEHGGREQQL